MQRLNILHPSIDDYLLDIIPERDEVLTEMEAHARANRFPIVGPLVGRVLHQLVLITNPTRIFEMGSGFGYSASGTFGSLNQSVIGEHLRSVQRVRVILCLRQSSFQVHFASFGFEKLFRRSYQTSPAWH